MKNKLYYNVGVSLLYQCFSLIIGLILPRLFLLEYGSRVNGLIQSISQMLSVIVLIDFGVGAVVQAALYKPLAENDENKISLLYSSANKYFKLVAKILVVYVFILMLYFSFFKYDEFNWLYSCTLIFSISISSFAQYYFGLSNSILLNADQKIYITTFVNLVTLVFNALLSIVLIKLHYSIQIVKLLSSLVFILRPCFLAYYVKKHYTIKIVKNPPTDSIPSKWSGLIQHIATVLTGTIDNIVLTLFSTFQAVSIYNVYIMPLNAVKTIMETITNSYKSFFGNLLANKQKDILEREFGRYELITHYSVVIIFGSISLVLVPFVLVYTKGINDTNYQNYLFSFFITLAMAIYSIRLPYTTIIVAAGKFKETQSYSLVECVINIVLSTLLVINMGLPGVAFATCVAVLYRTTASAFYLKKDILYRQFNKYLMFILVDLICMLLIFGISKIITVSYSNLLYWFFDSIVAFTSVLFVCTFIFVIFFHKQIYLYLKTKKEKL